MLSFYQRFAEKNQKLKEMLDRMQKTRQEQQDYTMKQAKLHLEEKNFYVNEVSTVLPISIGISQNLS